MLLTVSQVVKSFLATSEFPLGKRATPPMSTPTPTLGLCAPCNLLPVKLLLPVTVGKSFLPVNQLTGHEMKSLTKYIKLHRVLERLVTYKHHE